MTVKTQKPVKNLALYIGGGGGLAFQAPDTRRLCPRLTNREFFWRFPVYVITIRQRYGQTDGQTTCRSNTAFCVASRGKNCNDLFYYKKIPRYAAAKFLSYVKHFPSDRPNPLKSEKLFLWTDVRRLLMDGLTHGYWDRLYYVQSERRPNIVTEI